MKTLLSLTLTLLLFSTSNAATLNVPGVYPSIQSAINAAFNGDTVLVAPGTYMENIDFLGKAITVKSSNGPLSTFIDGGMAGSVVTFVSNEGPDSVLDGFTVMNGSGTMIVGAFWCGGGIYCSSSSPTIMNNMIIWNFVTGHGGGIYCCYDALPTVKNNQIMDNSSGIDGGGISCWDSSDALIDGNFIAGNIAFAAAGGIDCVDSDPMITANTIEVNQAIQGGGIRCFNSKATITRNIVKENWAVATTNAFGGGILCDASIAYIENNTITKNHSDDDGAGISCWNGSDAVIVNNIVMTNDSSMSAGGIDCIGSDAVIVNNHVFDNWALGETAIRCCHCSPTITNNTVCNNLAGGSSGACAGLSTYYASPVVTNTIFWNNTGAEIDVGLGSSPVVTYCDVEGGWPGTGNINANPLFVSLAGNDYHLTYQSPCRDAGTNAAPQLPDFDFESDPRIAWGGTVDMGADEFYTHMYITGDVTPGGSIEGKMVGLPGTTPVGLFIGSGVRSTPAPTAYGDFYLLPPKILIPLIPIPASGVLVVPTTIPSTPSAPYDLPMQGLVGLNPDSLTNLCVMEVR